MDMRTALETALGRPRDSRIDDAILEATRELLGESGYADLTFTAIAARAGTSVPALRRRWRSKAHLVHEAVYPASVLPGEVAADSLAEEVRLVVENCRAIFASAAGRRATPGLIADLVADHALQEELTDRLRTAVWNGLGVRLQAAADRGEARPDADVSVFIEMAFGAALMAVVLRGPEGLDDAWAAQLTDALLEGIAG